MRISSLRISLSSAMVALATLAFVFHASCDDKGQSKLGPFANVSARLCSEGGARFDEIKRECICDTGSKWSGSTCEPLSVNLTELAPLPAQVSPQPELPVVPEAAANPAPSASPKPARSPQAFDKAPAMPDDRVPADVAAPRVETPVASLPASKSPGDEAIATLDSLSSHDALPAQDAPTEPETPSSASTKASADSQFVRALALRCKAAKGVFQAADAYCHCGAGRLLSGRSCRIAAGKNVAREICRSAIRPGIWRGDLCSCEKSDTYFHAGRGGCTPPKASSKLTRRRICESAQDHGVWQAKSGQCQCPPGNIWHKDQCVRQSELSSAAVCRNPINAGRWDDQRRLCHCPKWRIWLDQSCRASAAIPEEKACTSEFNRGLWQEKLASCACGPGRTWRPAERSCSTF